MGSALVAARDEGLAAGGDRLQRIERAAGGAYFRRIVLRADEDEIVVHHVLAVAAVAFGDELVLGGAVVHEQHVGVAAAADVQRLAGADSDDADLDRGRLLELGQNPAEQAGLLGGGG